MQEVSLIASLQFVHSETTIFEEMNKLVKSIIRVVPLFSVLALINTTALLSCAELYYELRSIFPSPVKTCHIFRVLETLYGKMAQ